MDEGGGIWKKDQEIKMKGDEEKIVEKIGGGKEKSINARIKARKKDDGVSYMKENKEAGKEGEVSKDEGKMMGEAEKKIVEKIKEERPEGKGMAEQPRKVERETEELLTRLKYMQADFENFKKRIARERSDTIKLANEALLSDLLPVLDQLEAAIQIMPEGKEREGVKMVHTNFLKALGGNGLKEIKVDEKSIFNSDMQEAIGEEKSADEKLKGKVAKVVQAGYTLFGNVLRFAKVRVYVHEKGE